MLGAGGLGHLAIQFLREMGHSVTAFSHSPAKRELIERLGGAFADSSDPKGMTERQGEFDFILSTLNVAFDIDAYVRMLTATGPALPGGGAVDAAAAERRALEQFSAIHLWQLHRQSS